MLLRARLAGNRWPEHLPWVLFGLRAAPKEDSAISSAELVFGAPLTLLDQLLTPPETLVEDVVEALRSAQPLATQPFTYAEAASGLHSLQLAGFVFVRKGRVVPPLSPLYQGPYKVLDRREKFFELEIGGRPEVVSKDRLNLILARLRLPQLLLPRVVIPRDQVQWSPSSHHLQPPLRGPCGGWNPVDRNPRPSEDNYINILPDFLCSVVTYRSSNKELSLLVRILLRVATELNKPVSRPQRS
jgi:hypothetical protein